MRFVLLLASFALSACANLPQPVQETSSNPKNELAAQELNKGECGLFLWTIATPPMFVFFQKTGDEQAKLLRANKELILQAQTSTQIINDYGSFTYDYTTDSKHLVSVGGQFGDELQGGRKISSGSIHVTKPDGWKEIIPVSGVYACAS